MEKLNFRDGSKVHAVASELVKKKGKPVPVKDLLKAAYGNQKDENRGPLQMVLLGLKNRLKDKRLGKIERDLEKDTIVYR